MLDRIDASIISSALKLVNAHSSYVLSNTYSIAVEECQHLGERD